MKGVFYLSPVFGLLFCLGACSEEPAVEDFRMIAREVDNGNYQEKELEDISSSKIQVAQGVFDQLIRAKGNLSMLPPKLEVINSLNSAARFDPANRTIYLEEKAYDICRSFGPDSLNALACLLAHEMIHYYEKHALPTSFAKEIPVRTTGALELRTSFREQCEVEADYLGGLLAYSAGYQPYGIMPKFLEKVYKAYDLRENLPGYPSLNERVEYAHYSDSILRKLVHVFEVANVLVALEDYPSAKVCYEYIAPYYNSREIFNNLGIISIYSALDYFNAEEQPFILPVRLDSDTRLKGNRRGNMVDEDRERQREALVQEALNYFQQALALDPNYVTARVNLACTYLLEKDYRKAIFQAEEIELLAQEGTKDSASDWSDSYVVRGIAEGLRGNEELAVEYLKKALTIEDNRYAKQNLGLIQGKLKVPNIEEALTSESFTEEETIEGVSLADFSFEHKNRFDRRMELGENLMLYGFSMKFSHISQLVNSKKNFQLFIHHCDGRYKGTTNKGIDVRSPEEEVVRKYGAPDRSVNLSGGEMLVFREPRLIIHLDRSRRVRRWDIYLN